MTNSFNLLGSIVEADSSTGGGLLTTAIIVVLTVLGAAFMLGTVQLLPTQPLIEKRDAALNEMEGLNLLTVDGDYEWTDDEEKRYNELDTQSKKLDAQIKRYNDVNQRRSNAGSAGPPEPGGNGQPGVAPGSSKHVAVVTGIPGQNGGSPRINSEEGFVNDPKCGFQNIQDFLNHAMMYSEKAQGKRSDYKDPRTNYLSTIRVAARTGHESYINECHDGSDCGPGTSGSTSDATGSVFVPVEFAPDMFKTMPDMKADTLGTTQRTSKTPVVQRRYRVDKDHRESVTGGFVVGRNFEHCCLASSASKYESYTVNMTPLYGAYCASEMLLEMNRELILQEVADGFETEFDANRIVEILNGTGKGEYRGINQSNALITHTHGGSLEAADIWTMTSRLWKGPNGGGLWLAGLDYRKELRSLQNTETESQTNSVVLYDPNAGPDWADGMLDGNPVKFTEFVPRSTYKASLGLYNMREFEEFQWKPMRQASSLHARFMCNEAVFKFWTYTGGQDRWDSTLIPKCCEDAQLATCTLSPFVILNGTDSDCPQPARPHNKKRNKSA